MTSAPAAGPAWTVGRRDAGDAELRLSGSWIARETGVRGAADVDEVLAKTGNATRLHFDTRDLGSWDSALIVFLWALREAAARDGTRPIDLVDAGLPKPALRLLALAGQTIGPAPAGVGRPSPTLLAVFGYQAIAAWTEAVAVSTLLGETVLRTAAALGGRSLARAADVWQLVREAGPGALGIVTIVNVLVGGILAFVGAVQLRRFGAEIFVADLVGIAMVREMAVVMTAIVMAGRTGGAYAAHIATMQGNEEIDALRAFGIPVFDYLVLPRIVALVAMMPLLYIYGCALGLFGGLIVAVVTLDLTAAAYIEETRAGISHTHFLLGLAKSVSFGALVALAGCRIGLKAGRSAADVGRAATQAVVVGIIGIIALDAVFAVCADALGI